MCVARDCTSRYLILIFDIYCTQFLRNKIEYVTIFYFIIMYLYKSNIYLKNYTRERHVREDTPLLSI